jgi:hypothetical protein
MRIFNVRKVVFLLGLIMNLSIGVSNGGLTFESNSLMFSQWYGSEGGWGNWGDAAGDSGDSSGDNSQTNCYFSDILTNSVVIDCEVIQTYVNMEVCDNSQIDFGSTYTYSYIDQACVDARDGNNNNNNNQCPDGNQPCSYCGQCGCTGNCQGSTGGTTNEETKTVDCAGVENGTAYLNNCQECVGGTTNKTDCSPFCFPKTFNSGVVVQPVPYSSRFLGKGWCSFCTLATLESFDPCSYATYYYNNIRKDGVNVDCTSNAGVRDMAEQQQLYEHFGWIFYPTFFGDDPKCMLISQVSTSGVAALITTSSHVFLLYNFYRPNEQTNVDDIIVSKYDTNDTKGWNRNNIPLKEINLSGSIQLISR